MSRQPIVQERVVAASPERVFAAWSDPDSMRAWMCPNPEITHATVEIDFRVGGSFRIEMHGERAYVHTGKYLEIDPPHRLVFEWISQWMPADERKTRVTVSIEPAGENRSRLRLVHDELPETDSYDGHVQGWATILEKLDREMGKSREGQ